jgi:hypothetical protein
MTATCLLPGARSSSAPTASGRAPQRIEPTAVVVPMGNVRLLYVKDQIVGFAMTSDVVLCHPLEQPPLSPATVRLLSGEYGTVKTVSAQAFDMRLAEVYARASRACVERWLAPTPGRSR